MFFTIVGAILFVMFLPLIAIAALYAVGIALYPIFWLFGAYEEKAPKK